MASYYERMRSVIGKEPLLVAGAVVLIVKEGKVLLQRRLDDGLWAHHGGTMEQGEEIIVTAKRELLEETGLIANSLKLVDALSFSHVYADGNQIFGLQVIYLCTDFSGHLRPQAEEVQELRWFPLRELPGDFIDMDVIINERLCAGVYGTF